MIGVIMSGIVLVSCNDPVGPTTQTDPQDDLPPGTVILSEKFEGDALEYLVDGETTAYRQVVYTEGQTLMSLSSQHAHGGAGSLTSESNNTSIKRTIEPYIEDSVAGLQFYLMATKASQTNFFAAICKPGSAKDGLVTKFGMGIDASDSLKWVYQDDLNGAADVHAKFAPLTFNRWYKCAVEYDFSAATLTYFLDDEIVHTQSVPSLSSLQTFIVIRDGLGAQGSSGYYLDDVAVYKK